MREAIALAKACAGDRSVLRTGRRDDRLVPRPAENRRAGARFRMRRLRRRCSWQDRRSRRAGTTPMPCGWPATQSPFLPANIPRPWPPSIARSRSTPIPPWRGARAAGFWFSEPARPGDRSATAGDTAEPARSTRLSLLRPGSPLLIWPRDDTRRPSNGPIGHCTRSRVSSSRCASSSSALGISAAPRRPAICSNVLALNPGLTVAAWKASSARRCSRRNSSPATWTACARPACRRIEAPAPHPNPPRDPRVKPGGRAGPVRVRAIRRSPRAMAWTPSPSPGLTRGGRVGVRGSSSENRT